MKIRRLTRAIAAAVLSLCPLCASAQADLPASIHLGPFPAGHVQGIAVDAERGFVYASFTTMLVKTDMQGNVLGSVTGLLGHLGCLALNPEDGLLYGSLEYKNDAIGRGIMNRVGSSQTLPDAFYVAVFDVDSITQTGMDAQTSGVMRAAVLREPGEDYAASVVIDGSTIDHRLACSGIDGISFGPAFGKARAGGKSRGKNMVTVAYGIYGDNSRPDNDYQVLLQYDTRDVLRTAKTLSQSSFHKDGPGAAKGKYFVYTGNTNWGIQNLEYLPETGWWAAAVYRGHKPEYPNFSMFTIDGCTKPRKERLKGVSYISERQKIVPLASAGLNHGKSGIHGWNFKLGTTGMARVGQNLYYICRNSRTPDGQEQADLYLHRLTPGGPELFVPVE